MSVQAQYYGELLMSDNKKFVRESRPELEHIRMGANGNEYLPVITGSPCHTDSSFVTLPVNIPVSGGNGSVATDPGKVSRPDSGRKFGSYACHCLEEKYAGGAGTDQSQTGRTEPLWDRKREADKIWRLPLTTSVLQ